MPAVFVFPVLQRIIFNRKKPWHNTTAIKNALYHIIISGIFLIVIYKIL